MVVLDDPPLNLFTEETFAALVAARDEVAASDARAMVFRAEGKVFTGGVDVGRVFADVPGSEEGSRLAAEGIRDLQALESLEIPTLALVHGLCLTAGLEASLGCDMIWAAEGSKFGLVERVVGLTPFGGGVQRMAERAGPARAREFVMTGGLYDAERMLEWGVVNRVLPADELLEKGMKFARELAAGPTGRPRGDQAARPRLSGRRDRRRRRRHRRDRRAAFRHRRPQERGQELPRGRPGQRDLRGSLSGEPLPCRVAWPRKRRSRWRARSSRPCPTPCSR